MKKIIFREIFWLIFASIISLLLSFIFLEFIDLTSAKKDLTDIEKIFSVQLYFIGWIVSVFCIYIVRIIVYTIKLLTN
tara:strand:+ start:5150 stop:5383 length:234 start_codon:yes stop_codon:yes gene_type:complete